MSRVEERLGEMGITLPNLPAPLANYVPAKRAGNLVFTAGQISALEGREYEGKLGATLSIEDGSCQLAYGICHLGLHHRGGGVVGTPYAGIAAMCRQERRSFLASVFSQLSNMITVILL